MREVWGETSGGEVSEGGVGRDVGWGRCGREVCEGGVG